MAGGGGSSDRPRTHTRNDEDDGIRCPIVSCVLTISIPDDVCRSCGGVANSAPTIVCDQSILANCRRRRDGNDDKVVDESVRGARIENNNVGCLCSPRPNRLLAFDGSLLHGVLPGMTARRFVRPSTKASSRDDDNDRDWEEDGGGSDHHDDDDDDDGDLIAEANDDVENRRITLMMGFWKDVRTTTMTGDDASSSTGADSLPTVGPNVPYSPRGGTWTEEFEPIPVSDDDLSSMETRSVTTDETMNGLDVIDPLWIPIADGNTTEEDAKSFGEYSRHDGDDVMQRSSRFFLKSMDPRVIDDEMLSRT